MKKKTIRIPIVAIILIITAIFICITIVKKQVKNASIAESERKTAEFQVSNIIAKSGEEITLSIKMPEDSNFVAANFELLYDGEKMQYIGYEEGNILKESAMSIVNNDKENNKILIAYIANPKNKPTITTKGELLNITFKINKSVTDVEITPEFKCTTLKGSDGEDIESVISQGTIIVK